MRNKNKKVYFVLILIVLFGISIGYAAISRTLSIAGNSEVKQNTWNVYFDNVLVTNGSVTSNLPVIDTTTKSTVSFDVMLNLPGDFYEFTVDVVNSGTIDAMIESIENMLNLSEEQKKYVNYTITYQGGEDINSKQLVKSNDYLRIKVRVEYRSDIIENDLPNEFQNLDLSFTLNYVQADSTAIEIKNHGMIGSTGDINEIGTIVTIGTEKFYVIGTEGDNVKLLSMYNLYVGNQYDYDNGVVALASPTGKQSETAIGWFRGFSADNPIIGATAFSSDSQKGINYSDYTGSIVEGYINNYKDILENDYNVDVVEARLITKAELTSKEIGCSVENRTCSNAPSFIYSTTYWSGAAYNTHFVWRVDSNGNFNNYIFNYDYYAGVRPVIFVLKDYFV